MSMRYGFRGKLWKRRLADEASGVRFSKNVVVRLLAIAGMLFSLIALGLFLYFIRPTDSLLILHYNIYFGVDLLGLWWQAYILPVLCFVLFLGHFSLARYFYYQHERVAAYLFLLGFVLVSLSLLVASVAIVYINY